MKYRTIVADPPWRVNTGPASGRGMDFETRGQHRSQPLAYPTMTLEEISALPVAEMVEDDAALYLWTTNGYLRNAFDVLAAWGFAYSTTIVWTKNPIGTGLGGAWGISTEFVLYGRRGSPVERKRQCSTWWGWKRPYDKHGRPRHSAKNPALQDLIEEIHEGPFLELFAREQRLGWHTWGNEALEHAEMGAA